MSVLLMAVVLGVFAWMIWSPGMPLAGMEHAGDGQRAGGWERAGACACGGRKTRRGRDGAVSRGRDS